MLLCPVHPRSQIDPSTVEGSTAAAGRSVPTSVSLRNLCALCVSALDFSRLLLRSAPLSSRWSPVVTQRETLPILFPFRPLRRSVLHNVVGIPSPVDSLPSPNPSLPLSIPLTPSLSYSCELFCTTDSCNCFRFNFFHTLAPKPPGVGIPLPTK